MLSTWLAITIHGVEIYTALFEGVRRVPVISLRGMIGPMTFGSVPGGDAIAATFFLYRALRHWKISTNITPVSY